MWRVDDELNKDNSCSMMAKKKPCDLLTQQKKNIKIIVLVKKRVEAHKIKWGMFMEYFTHDHLFYTTNHLDLYLPRRFFNVSTNQIQTFQCVRERPKKFWTKQKTITPPPPPLFKLNGWSLNNVFCTGASQNYESL
jgi:hypothetical protein